MHIQPVTASLERRLDAFLHAPHGALPFTTPADVSCLPGASEAKVTSVVVRKSAVSAARAFADLRTKTTLES